MTVAGSVVVQLMKLTFGFWDRELIEAFKIRDRADGEEGHAERPGLTTNCLPVHSSDQPEDFHNRESLVSASHAEHFGVCVWCVLQSSTRTPTTTGKQQQQRLLTGRGTGQTLS